LKRRAEDRQGWRVWLPGTCRVAEHWWWWCMPTVKWESIDLILQWCTIQKRAHACTSISECAYAHLHARTFYVSKNTLLPHWKKLKWRSWSSGTHCGHTWSVSSSIPSILLILSQLLLSILLLSCGIMLLFYSTNQGACTMVFKFSDRSISAGKQRTGEKGAINLQHWRASVSSHGCIYVDSRRIVRLNLGQLRIKTLIDSKLWDSISGTYVQASIQRGHVEIILMQVTLMGGSRWGIYSKGGIGNKTSH